MTDDHLIYALRDGLPYCVASCDGDALAFCLQTLRDENQIADDDRVGILYRPADAPAGRWLINPWASERSKT